ncbi:hypothetical protein [Psychrobacter sp. I-STPA10]|uniref:hypothetical protein n=1 Tax=Psychrobacter sp. I-STPA10 TaxID=2585769 RepID=UPI001E4B9596|nr:hypothetical protein [Psychrobacter sp. I-STPA10]
MSATQGLMPNIAIFKIGNHTSTDGNKMSVSADMLKAVAKNYQANTHEAPAVIGHPKDNHPAYAWVESLSFDESDGVLYANFKDVEPQFAQMLKDKRFKKRSASFYPPNHPSNPTPDMPYLRHVGFLGAQPPAIKGLKDFTELGDVINCSVYEFSEFDIQQPSSPNQQDTLMSDNTTNPDKTTNTPKDTNPAIELAVEKQKKLEAKEQELAAKEAAIAQREADFAKKEAAIKTQNFSDFADGLITKGQLMPAEKDALVAVMLDLDSTPKTFDFAENGVVNKKTSVDVLQNVLSRLPVTIDFSEHTGDDPNTAARPQYQFATGMNDDELDKQIQDYANSEGISYAEAALSFAK